MELQQFLEMMERREAVPADSPAHELMHRCYAESQRLMLDYNTNLVGGIPAKFIKQIPQE